MENKVKTLLLIILLIIGCKRKADKKLEIWNVNSLLTTSLDYILTNKNLPQEYKNQPLQIVQYGKNKIVEPLKINGRQCILLPENANVYKIMEGMDIFKPIPLVEIIDIEFSEELVIIDIIFRSTGHEFILKLKKNNEGIYKVKNIDEGTI